MRGLLVIQTFYTSAEFPGPGRLANQAIHRTFGFWDVPWMDDEMGLG